MKRIRHDRFPKLLSPRIVKRALRDMCGGEPYWVSLYERPRKGAEGKA